MADDYAELLKLLRQAPGELVLLRQKAADEIEALVKEKNDALERAHLSDYAAERNAKRVDELVKERDDLLKERGGTITEMAATVYQRGREAGIREAAECARLKHDSPGCTVMEQHAARIIEDAILALLPTPEPEK